MDKAVKRLGVIFAVFGFVFLMISGLVCAEETPLSRAEGVRAAAGAGNLSSAPGVYMLNGIPTVMTAEKVSGEVISLQPKEIGLIYKRTETAEYELRLPVGERVKFSGFNQYSELGAGDVVRVDYTKTVQFPDEPEEKRLMEATVISLVKKNKPEKAEKGVAKK
jgi:hypothetical protein